MLNKVGPRWPSMAVHGPAARPLPPFLHSTFYILHSTFYILHSAFYILHSTFYILHSTFNVECRMQNVESRGGPYERFWISGLSKNVKKHWLNKVLRTPIPAFKKPYKTCRKWRLLGPFSEKGPENDQKSITIIVFSQRVFKTSRNSVTPLEFADFHNAKTRCGKPYKTCRTLRLLEPKSEMD